MPFLLPMKYRPSYQ